MLNNHFQHNLLGMQVDAVFDSLSALIETERIKLKALVAPSLQSIPASMPQAHQTPVVTQVQDEPAAQEGEKRQSDPSLDPAADRHSSGLGLSKAERELVEKMQSFQTEHHRKLEAVA
jgi:hypothetical protein